MCGKKGQIDGGLAEPSSLSSSRGGVFGQSKQKKRTDNTKAKSAGSTDRIPVVPSHPQTSRRRSGWVGVPSAGSLCARPPVSTQTMRRGLVGQRFDSSPFLFPFLLMSLGNTLAFSSCPSCPSCPSYWVRVATAHLPSEDFLLRLRMWRHYIRFINCGRLVVDLNKKKKRNLASQRARPNAQSKMLRLPTTDHCA